MNPIIAVTNVVKTNQRGRQRVEALHGLTLPVAPGEFLVLMGPSGSGKNTLLKLMSGPDRADTGEVIVAGENIGTLSSARLAQWRARHVGLVWSGETSST